MKKKRFGGFVGLVLLVAGGIAFIKKLFNYFEDQGENYCLSTYDDLLRNQKTVDELNAAEITEWIEEFKRTSPGEYTYILAYPTKDILQKYHLKGFPDMMDKEHNIIIMAVRKNDYVPVKIQMISFGTVEPYIEKELFQGTDYAVVEE